MCWCTCLNRQIINHSDFVLANKLWIYDLPQTKQSWLQIQIGNKYRATKLIFYGRRTRIRKTQFVVFLWWLSFFFWGREVGVGWDVSILSCFCCCCCLFFSFLLFICFFNVYWDTCASRDGQIYDTQNVLFNRTLDSTMNVLAKCTITCNILYIICI